MGAGIDVFQDTSPTLNLYNNSKAGRYLFVYGFQMWTDAGSTNLASTLFVSQGVYPGLTAAPTIKLCLDEPPEDGIFSYGPGGTQPAGYITLTALFGGASAFQWQQNYPLVILPPGWGISSRVEQVSIHCGGGYQWYAGEKYDKHPLITLDASEIP